MKKMITNEKILNQGRLLGWYDSQKLDIGVWLHIQLFWNP